jgi:hypothetical protein
MSTGQRQRVKLAQAIVHDPVMVLLDSYGNHESWSVRSIPSKEGRRITFTCFLTYQQQVTMEPGKLQPELEMLWSVNSMSA